VNAMVRELVILGAGGFGREASLLVEQINAAAGIVEFKLLGFIDSDRSKWGLTHRGYSVLGDMNLFKQPEFKPEVICVIAEPQIKQRIVENVPLELCYANLIHPDVQYSAADVRVGEGVLINKGCLLTTNIRIGNHVSINPGCGIGHDVVIGDYTTLMWRVNLSGNVTVGEGCLIGSGATVLQGLTIGSGVTVGAGAVVTKDLPDGCTAVGVPARVIK
jgi:sugar O-acyltransferase (sialic acid O-acetyltransferase NeuD family)